MPLESEHPKISQSIKLLEKLIAFPTISTDSNLELINFAAEFLEKAGANIRIWKSPDGARANCFATIGPEGNGGLVLSGHSDVVPVEGQDWSADPFTLTKKDNRLFGRGTCDMKGFIACAMAMTEDFTAMKLNRPLHIALTYEEETGCFGGIQLADDLVAANIKPDVCIVGEPTSMRIIEGHKGCYEYTTHFKGLAAHGSLTHRGVNAIEYAALYITKLMEIREELKNSSPEAKHFEPPYTTLQMGKISGGVSRNTIAGDCAVEWDMRPVNPQDAEFVKSKISQYVEDDLLPQMRTVEPKASIDLEIVAEVIGLTPATDSEARQICAALTGDETTGVVSFGTEAGLYQQIGMSTVVCGPGSIEQAHKPDEFIEISELGRCLNMLELLKDKLT